MNSRDIARNERAAHELLANRKPRVQQRLPRQRINLWPLVGVLLVSVGGPLCWWAVAALVRAIG